MWISYIYNPVVILETLVLVISMYYDGLSLVKVLDIYKKAEYCTDKYYTKKAETQMTHTQALEFCLAAKMEMFEPTGDMKLIELMRHHKVEKIWTSFYTHKITKLLVNEQVELPVTSTADSTIDLPAPLAVSDLGNKGIIVQINALNQTSYAVSEKSELAAAFCIELLPYPFKSAELSNVKESQEYALKDIAEFKSDMKKLNRSADLTSAYDKQFDLILRIQRDLEPIANETVKKWRKIKEPTDLISIHGQHKHFTIVFDNIIEEILEPLFYPQSMIELEDRDRVDPMFLENMMPTLAMSENPEKVVYFFLHFLENGTSDSLPIHTYKVPLDPVFDPAWEGTFRLSIADFIFLSFVGMSLIVVFGSILNCCMNLLVKRNSWKKWREYEKGRRGSKTEMEIFVSKKVRLPDDSPQSAQRKVLRPRARSIDITGKIVRPSFPTKSPKKVFAKPPKRAKKRQAPIPTKRASLDMTGGNYEVEVYRSPPKPQNKMYYVIKNANLPASDGYSDLDE
jgi:protein-tyrosine-phosphatase